MYFLRKYNLRHLLTLFTIVLFSQKYENSIECFEKILQIDINVRTKIIVQ